VILSIQHCSDAELPHVEAKWQAEGYRRVARAQDTDLGEFEYVKRRSAAAPGDERTPWMLVRREPGPSVRL